MCTLAGNKIFAELFLQTQCLAYLYKTEILPREAGVKTHLLNTDMLAHSRNKNVYPNFVHDIIRFIVYITQFQYKKNKYILMYGTYIFKWINTLPSTQIKKLIFSFIAQENKFA